MKYSIVINVFKRTQFINRAIQSCQRLTKNENDEIEIIVVSDYNIPNDSIKKIFSTESAVGYRYALGLKEATGDWIMLLDDDDYFLPDKLKLFSMVEYYNFPAMIKEYGKYHKGILRDHFKDIELEETMTLRDVIKKHIDWHISEYSFNQKFKDRLLENNMKKVNVSLDKFIFANGLSETGGSYACENLQTFITYHSNSRMHSMNKQEKKAFYIKTAEMIGNISPTNISLGYLDYNYKLNMFLATGNKEYFNEIKYNMPFVNRLYYKFRRQ